MVGFLPYTILLLLACICGSLGSAITSFTDDQCKKSHDALDVKNGYPDGLCTPLKITGNLEAFQIVQLDPSCAVTLYGPDDASGQACSSSLKIVGQLATCYNSSWIYYSVDGCSTPTSSSAVVLPTAKSSSSSTSSTLASTDLSSSPSSSSSSSSSPASAAATSSPPPKQDSSHPPTAVIIGAIIGSVAVCAALIGLLIFCLYRHKTQLSKPPHPPSYELSQERALVEAARGSIAPPARVAQKEMWASEAAVEIGRNSYVPPVELPASSWAENKKRGSALIHVHMAR